MINIISQRHRVETVCYCLFFPALDCPGTGWAPACDEHGKVLCIETNQAVKDAVVKHYADPNYGDPYVQTLHHSYMEPAIGRCYCGAEVVLSDPMDNDCRNCGRIYNSSGQEVACHAREAEEPYEDD